MVSKYGFIRAIYCPANVASQVSCRKQRPSQHLPRVSVVTAASVVEIAGDREAEVRAGSAHRGKDRVESERREESVRRVPKASVRHGHRESVRRVPRENAPLAGSAHRDKVVKDLRVRHGPRESVRHVHRENAHHAAAELGVLSRHNSRNRHNQLRRLQRHRLCPMY